MNVFTLEKIYSEREGMLKQEFDVALELVSVPFNKAG
jgi:hypothetical protein